MADFKTLADVQVWVDAKGVETLRAGILGGAFSPDNRALAVAWLEWQQRLEDEKFAAEGRDLERRATVAAESSADASLESARQAGKSARWAMWAVVAAVAALAVAAWPFIVARS